MHDKNYASRFAKTTYNLEWRVYQSCLALASLARAQVRLGRLSCKALPVDLLSMWQ